MAANKTSVRLFPHESTNQEPKPDSPPDAPPRGSTNPRRMDCGSRIVVAGGPFAGFPGILLLRRGTGRCLVQVDRQAGRLLIEVDEGFVQSAG